MLRRVCIALIHAYRWCISPLLGQHCRFHPSCSQYAIEALQTHTLPRAACLILHRLGRCQPWHAGGYDPVPPCACSHQTHSRQAPTRARENHPSYKA